VQQRYFLEPYRFVPPYRSRLWCRFATPLLPQHLRKKMGVHRIEFRGLEHFRDSIRQEAGVVLTPNHCRWADGMVMAALGVELKQYFYYLVSYHLFKQSRWQRWSLRRLGSYSVHREGADHESIRATSQILAAAERPVVIFPEGTWFRQNDRLGPIQDGVGLIARHAAKSSRRPIVVHPVAVKYWMLEDPRPALHERLGRLEKRIGWHPQDHLELIPRLEKFGSALLALKETEYLGCAQPGDLAQRIRGLGEALVGGFERENGMKPVGDSLFERIRVLRQRLVRRLGETADDPVQNRAILRTLDVLLFCENLISHSQDYLHERPSLERLTEAVQRIEETVTDEVETAVVPMGVVIEVGRALPVADYPRPKAAARQAGDPLILAIGREVQRMLDGLLAGGPPIEWGCPAPVESSADRSEPALLNGEPTRTEPVSLLG
jgi:1-acyl-sn-glycerol-3-phosphate acyltransferase